MAEFHVVFEKSPEHRIDVLTIWFMGEGGSGGWVKYGSPPEVLFPTESCRHFNPMELGRHLCVGKGLGVHC